MTTADGVLDEAKAKLSKRELSKCQIAKFEFPQIRRVYATQMDKGKVSMVISEDANYFAGSTEGNQKTFKVMIHDAEPEQLKKMCQMIEQQIDERKKKIEEREIKGD